MPVRTYSIKNQGASFRVSPNFTLGEFQCHDHSDRVLLSTELVEVLEGLRAHFGLPVHINSGFRTKAYNARIGGAADSQHCKGTAADIRIPGVSPHKVYTHLAKTHKGGLGKYPTFTHVDVRPNRARWKG